jgi:hypothetical protein
MSQKRKEHSMNANNASNSANREKALEAALGQIERQFGKGTVMRMGDSDASPFPLSRPVPWAWMSPWASAACRRAASAKSMARSPRARRR